MKNSKNPKMAAAAAQRTLAKWLSDGTTKPKGLYRDPLTGG